jgi:hypothetical protein
MAKNKVEIDVKVDDKGTTKKVALGSKKAAEGLDKTAKSARTADRNLKGAAQTSANGTKNFSKMAQGISGGLVPAYATLAANIFALTAAFNFLRNAATVALLEESQVSYAQNTGVAMDRLTSTLRQTSKGMLDFQAAAQASAIGVAKGFSSEQMNSLADGALKVSNVLGRDFTDAFDRLVRGVSKAEPELLDELGITLRLETATKNYAASLDKSADSLTSAERSQAVYLETMRQLEQVTAGQEGIGNPFVQLGVTFSDLIKNITQFFLPAFEAVASFINKNATAALAFFGILAAGIIKSMPFVNTLKSSISDFVERQEQGLTSTGEKLAQYRSDLDKTRGSIEKLRAAGAQTLQQGAKQAVASGSTSPVLTRASTGTMSNTDRANLKKALVSAEKQYMTHGKIVSGIFKGVSIDVVRNMSSGFSQSALKAETFGMRIKRIFTTTGLRAKKLSAQIRVGITKAFIGAGKAAAGFGKAMNMAMKATVILGIIQALYDMVMALINAPATIIRGLVGVGKGALNILVNYLISQVNKIPGVDINPLEQLTFATRINEEIDETINNLQFMKKLDAYEKQRQDALRANEIFKSVKENAQSTSDSLNTILSKGSLSDEKVAKAISSLGVSGLFDEALSIQDTDKRKQAIDAISKELDRLEELSPRFAEAVKAGDAALVDSLTKRAGAYIANIDDVRDKIENLGVLLGGQKTATGVKVFVENLRRTATAAAENGEALDLNTTIINDLNEAFKSVGGIDTYINKLKTVEQEAIRLADAQKDLNIDKIIRASAPGAVGRQENLKITAKQEQIKLQRQLNELQRLENDKMAIQGVAEQELHQEKINQLKREIEVQSVLLKQAQVNMTEIGQLGTAVGNSLTSSMQSAFDGLIQGTMSAKDAFASMAKSMLQSIAKIISELLVAKILTAALGGTGFGNFLGIPSGRSGGMFEPVPGYSQGGIARGRDSGYPAILHGTEAVVPLPNGNAIPVEFKHGAGSQMNNVTVNVSIDNDGNAQQSAASSNQQGMDIGNVIAAAVQRELQNQKRSGGILNPYGTA